MTDRKRGADEAFIATVHGRVQGVGFRYHTRSTAIRLGLAGYVRNMADGSVEVVCEGDRRSIEKMTSWLRKGPPSARVTSVDVRRREPQSTYRGFNVEL